MNLGEVLFQSFLKGEYDAKDFVILHLQKGKGKLNKFLVKEFRRKKVKFSPEKFAKNGKVVFAFGKNTNWWLVEKKRFVDLNAEFEDKVEYVIPLIDDRLSVVAVKK